MTTFNGWPTKLLHTMARYVHPDVRELADSPAEGDSARVTLVPEEDHISRIMDRVDQLGGSVARELPSGVLIVEVPQEQLTTLIEEQGIESISPDEQMEILA